MAATIAGWSHLQSLANRHVLVSHLKHSSIFKNLSCYCLMLSWRQMGWECLPCWVHTCWVCWIGLCSRYSWFVCIMGICQWWRFDWNAWKEWYDIKATFLCLVYICRNKVWICSRWSVMILSTDSPVFCFSPGAYYWLEWSCDGLDGADTLDL